MAIDPTTLRLRYDAFANVTDERIQYWLTDAARTVDATWGVDQEPATLALAAHNMVLNNVPGITQTEASELGPGITRFRSASVDISVTDAVANAGIAIGYSATRYGAEFAVMQRRHLGGPRLVGYVEPRCCW